jgi:hypothetical protein
MNDKPVRDTIEPSSIGDDTELPQPELIPAPDPCQGIPAEFHDIVRTYGRDMFALVVNMRAANELANLVGAILNKHASRHGLSAIASIGNVLNLISTDYALSREWTNEVLMECDKDIRAVVERKIIIPGQSPLILKH